MKTLFIDVDDTLLRYKDGFIEWMKTKHPKVKFDQNTYFPEGYVEEFQEDVMFSYLEPVEGAWHGLNDLKHLSVNIRLLTASVNSKLQEYYRSANLAEEFGAEILKNAVYLGYRKSKISWVLKNYKDRTKHDQIMLVDDNPRYIEEFQRVGCKAIQYKGPFTGAVEGVPLVYDWETVVELVKEWVNDEG